MKTLQAKINKSENPFYGSSKLLNMFQQLPKMGSAPIKTSIYSYLTAAYDECSNDEQKKELFYTILFSIGDVNNREHNLFSVKKMKDVDQGGNSLRKAFFYCLEWMLTFNEETKNQFYEFLPIISEYTNIENLFLHQLRTDRKKGNVTEKLMLPIDIEKVTSYIASVINNPRTTDISHTLWAKFLPRPDFSVRKRTKTVLKGREKSVEKITGKKLEAGQTFILRKELKPETKLKEQFEFNFISSLSKKLGWEIIKYPKNTKFKGLEEYKKKYLKMTEAHLFSSKEILNWDRDAIINWFNTLPSSARFRVQKRIFNLDATKNQVSTKKWITKNGEDIADIYEIWQKGKLAAQETLLSFTTEDKKNMSKTELKQFEKAAKVNTAGETIVNVLAKLKATNLSATEAKLVSQSVIDKIKCDVPVLVFADISSSMQSSSVIIEGVNFTAHELASIAATAFLTKNPDPDLKGLFGVFSTQTIMLSDYNYSKSKSQSRTNRFTYKQNETQLTKNARLIDTSKHFIDNLKNIREVMNAYDFGSTNIQSIATCLKEWVDSDKTVRNERIEQILKYPVILAVSDGDLNGWGTSKETLLKFQSDMRQWFGWDGIIVIWDVKRETYGDGNKFDDVQNAMYFGSANISVLNQIFLNINDLDIVDTYLPLLALYRSNRYEPVRELVNRKIKKSRKITEDVKVS